MDGRPLPHAVSEVQDSGGNPLFTYEYDKNGNMTAARGQSKITIRAKAGDTGTNPEMELWLAGGKKIGWTVTESEYQEFSWYVYWDTSSLVDVVFANGNEAADLFVDWVEVNGVRKEAEGGEAEYNQGAYTAGCFDGVDVSPGQEQRAGTGALRFGFAGVLALDRAISYDDENRMTQVNDNGILATFAYNARGNQKSLF